MAVPMRAVFMKVNMASRPLLGSPIKVPMAPSKFSTAVALAAMPILCSNEPVLTPLRAPTVPSAATANLGTTNSEMPRVPAGAPGRMRVFPL
jgi:hypothetical protein